MAYIVLIGLIFSFPTQTMAAANCEATDSIETFLEEFESIAEAGPKLKKETPARHAFIISHGVWTPATNWQNMLEAEGYKVTILSDKSKVLKALNTAAAAKNRQDYVIVISTHGSDAWESPGDHGLVLKGGDLSIAELRPAIEKMVNSGRAVELYDLSCYSGHTLRYFQDLFDKGLFVGTSDSMLMESKQGFSAELLKAPGQGISLREAFIKTSLNCRGPMFGSASDSSVPGRQTAEQMEPLWKLLRQTEKLVELSRQTGHLILQIRGKEIAEWNSSMDSLLQNNALEAAHEEMREVQKAMNEWLEPANLKHLLTTSWNAEYGYSFTWNQMIWGGHVSDSSTASDELYHHLQQSNRYDTETTRKLITLAVQNDPKKVLELMDLLRDVPQEQLDKWQKAFVKNSHLKIYFSQFLEENSEFAALYARIQNLERLVRTLGDIEASTYRSVYLKLSQ
jgi:hypothetical protein